MMQCALLHVGKSYNGKTVLSDFTFEAEEGGIYALTGPSGCGKTTVLRLLCGLEQPDEGEVRRVLHAGVVFQEERFAEDASAFENVRMILPGKTAGRAAKRERDREIRLALKELLPEDEIDKPVRELSGGMRRRTAVVRALMSPAPVLIMDEPFAGLDPGTREKTAAFIQERRGGRTLIAAVHEPEELPFGIRVPVYNSGGMG